MAEAVFVDTKSSYVLSSGKTIVIPKMSLRILMVTSSVIGEFIKEIRQDHPNILEGFINNKQEDFNVNFFNTFLTQLPIVLPDIFAKLLKNVVNLVSAYTKVTEEEILDEWSTEDLIGVLNPFFAHILLQFNQIMEKLPKQNALPNQ